MADQYPLAREGGLFGPVIEKSLQLLHARELAKSMLTGGVSGGIPSFQQGGTVPSTGVYQLHEGETVIPASGAVPGSQTPTPDETTKRLLEMLTRSATTPHIAAQPHPMPVPGRVDASAGANIGMGTDNPHAWGFERFAAQISGQVRNAVAAQKEKQVSAATADWEYLKEAGDELEAAKASGDQKGIAAAQSKVQAILGDAKKVKRMQKALQMSWLDPSKTDAYTEGMNRMMKQAKEEETRKKGAAESIKRMVRPLLQAVTMGGKKEPQLSPDESARMSKELYAKIPMTRAGSDAKSQLEISKTILDIEKAAHEARETYYPPVPDENGVLRSVNKTNPKDVVTVRDAETGKPIQGIPKGPAPKVLTNGLVPYAVARDHKVIMPGDAEWTEHDQKMYDGALGAAHEKQLLRIDPIIAAEIGPPPDPKDFAKGRSDPGYGDALKTWAKEADAIRVKNGVTLAQARGTAYNATKPVQAILSYDAEGRPIEAWTTAGRAIAEGMAGGSEGAKLTTREAQMKDIEYSSTKMREAVKNLDTPFTAAQIAKLYLATHTEDETLARTEIAALAAQDLTDKQMDFVVWMGHINERSMSMRQVAGMGQGAQDLRNAIRGVLPGLRSGNEKMMLKQLDAFDNQAAILHKGIPKAGKNAPKEKPQADTGDHPSWFHPAADPTKP